MRGTLVIGMLAALLLTAFATPWPVGVTPAGQDSSWTIMTSYGNFHFDWEDVATADSFANFHFGIDIPDYPGFVGEDTVRSVRDGYVTYRLASVTDIIAADSQYALVICDSMSSSDGWFYGHMDTPYYSDSNAVYLSDPIAVMDPLVEPNHLHFMRSLFEYSHQNPGLLNPLDSLIPPASSDSGFVWEFATSADTLFFLEEMDYLSWPQFNQGHPEDVWQYQVEPDNIHDAVDLFYGYRLLGNGTNPISFGEFPLNPHMIKWTASRYLASDTSQVLNRYVVEFTGQIGASADSTKYRQFYFRWSRLNYLIPSLGNGLISCLTNCGDANSWDGIDNIEENCWQTDIDNELSGVTANPVLAAYPDGPYRIDVYAYAYDTTVVNTPSLDIELHNFDPVVEKVVLSCEGRTVWEAYWTADGLTPVLNNPVDAGVLPDQQLDVTVVFSEPMDTTSVTVTAGFASPYNDITASDTGLDWSWTNCPEEPEYKDTWHGEFDDLSGLTGGRITLSIQASDQDANGLMDPSIPCSDGTDYNDTHHSFSLMGVQPGWPVTLSDNCYGAPTLGDLDGDGDLDVSLICDDGNVYLLDDDGSSLIPGVWPEVINNWSCYPSPLKSSPALADLYEDGDLDMIGFLLCGCSAEAVTDGSNIPGWPVYPGDPEDSLLTAEYPGQTSPTLGDLDGDYDLEVLFTRHLADSSTILQHTICMYEHTGGEETWSRNLQYSTGGASVISTPAVADFDNDGACEVVVCTAEGFNVNTDQDSKDLRYGQSAVYLLDGSDGSTIWKTSFSAWFQASPVIADVDDDGTLEIIVGTDFASGSSDRRKILVLNGDTGSVEYEEEYNDPIGGVYFAAALGKLNGDSCLDFVVPCTNQNIYAYSGADYSKLFSVDIGETPGSPILVDIDSDMEVEIIFGTSSGNLWALNTDGTTCSGFPVAVGGDIRACPAAGDIDGDGHLEIVMVDADNPAVYSLDLGAGTYPTSMPWRQFQHDSWHTGCYATDNTIPAPPTILQVEQQTDDVSMIITWDLSVNDPYSSSPEEPTDVISYQVFRELRPGGPLPSLVGHVHAGEDTFTDTFDPMGYPIAVYCLSAYDGTNYSAISNKVKVRIEPADLISFGCSVIEEFGDATPVSIRSTTMISSSRIDDTDSATLSSSSEAVSASHRGNPSCLTDGSFEEIYTSSQGAESIVIDLGEECSVTAVITEDQSTDHSDIVGTPAIDIPEHNLRIEVAGSDRSFEPFNEGALISTEGVRYVRVYDASGLAEISVYGTRSSVNAEPLSLEVVENLDSEGWSFAVPLEMLENGSSGELSVKIFDITGRMIWSGRTQSSSVLHWDGCSEGIPVPSGVYLIQSSIGSEVSTGSFVVRRDR